MRIKIADKHYLNSDAQCYWISQEVEVKKGRNKGNLTEKRVSGYYRLLTELLANFAEAKVRSADAETMTELKQAVKDTEKVIREMTESLKHFNKELKIKDGEIPL